MSRNGNSVAQLILEIGRMTVPERLQIYGIEIADDGTVKDLVEDRTHKTIKDWAIAFTEDDEPAGVEIIGRGPVRYFEDEY